MLPVPALSQIRAMAVLRLPVAYVRESGVAMESCLRVLTLLERQRLRLLRRMRVVGRGVELELGEHLAAEDSLGEHSLDGLLDREGAVAREEVTVALGRETAGDAGVVVVELLVELGAGQRDLVGV